MFLYPVYINCKIQNKSLFLWASVSLIVVKGLDLMFFVTTYTFIYYLSFQPYAVCTFDKYLIWFWYWSKILVSIVFNGLL